MTKKVITAPVALQACELWPHASRSATGQALHVWREGSKRRTKLAARLIWEICSGKPLAAEHVVVLTCNEPMCVFFGHMALQTRKELAKRRRKRFTLPDCPASVAKLPVETRIMLTICVANDIGTNAKLARRFGVTPYQVRTIRDYVRKEKAANLAADAQQQAATKSEEGP